MNVLKKQRGVLPEAVVVLIIGFLISIPFCSARAQVNPVYERMVKNGWRYPAKKELRDMTRQERNARLFKRLGYNDSTIANLRRAGVDIVQLLEHRVFNKKIWTALSDCIVIGTVSKITYPSWPRPWYHTVVYVHVEQFLRNNYGLPGGDVAVLEASGPTGKPNIVVTEIGEDQLNVGEHVLLFLSASGLINFAANNNMRQLYNRLIGKRSIYFEKIAKYDIRGGEVLSNTEKENLGDVTDSIRSVLDVINQSMPIKKES